MRVEGAGRSHGCAGKRRPEDFVEEDDGKTRTMEREVSLRVLEWTEEVENEVYLPDLG